MKPLSPWEGNLHDGMLSALQDVGCGGDVSPYGWEVSDPSSRHHTYGASGAH